MKIIVPIKQVIDAGARIQIKQDGSGIDLSGARMAANPFDEIALEEAVRIKEGGQEVEVVAVTVGPPKSAEVLRSALAVGADRVLRIDHDGPLDGLGLAKILAAIVRRENADLVLAGKQSTDGDSNQVGQMLAALLGWPQATFASAITIKADGTMTVTREVDQGLATLDLPRPAVVTADLRLNVPRYASLPNVMKAKKKPIEEVAATELGVDFTPKLALVETRAPAQRAKGVVVNSVDELIAKLRDEAKVLQLSQ